MARCCLFGVLVHLSVCGLGMWLGLAGLIVLSSDSAIEICVGVIQNVVLKWR